MVTIRPARPADIDSLTALLKTLFAIEADFVFNETRQRRGLAMLLATSQARLLVAEVSGTGVVGMCSGQLTISTAQGGFSLLVEDVVVKEAWRGQGVGSRLLAEIGTWGKDNGATRVQLLADRQNEPALSFYRQTGWQPTRLICLRKS